MFVYCDSGLKEYCIVFADLDRGRTSDPIVLPHEGQPTVNEGEYIAVISALEMVRDRKLSDVTILTDSLLVASQVQGHWRLREPRLQPFRDKVRQLIEETNSKIFWICREENLAGKVLEL